MKYELINEANGTVVAITRTFAEAVLIQGLTKDKVTTIKMI